MNVITPTAAQRASTPTPTVGTTPLGRPKNGDGRVQVAEAKSKQKYAAIAANDKKFEDFATALTGTTAEQRSPDENRALAQLRNEMAEGSIDPTFVEANPANGPGDDKLPPGARGAFVRGSKGAQGRVLISGTLRGQQLQKTSDEEQGEAVSDRARQLGIGVADGDAGARVGNVANGKQVTRQSDAALFRDQKDDTITVIADGKLTAAEADAGGVNNQYIRNLDDPEKRISYLLQFDKNADGWLDRHELAQALQTTPEHAERFIRIYGIGARPGEYLVPIYNSLIDGVGVDDMIADGSLAPNTDTRTEYLWTDLYNAKPKTLALAMLRAGTARMISDGDKGPYEDIFKSLQQFGMTAEHISWTAEWIFGDKRALAMSNGHADAIAQNFGRQGVDQKMRVDMNGMLQIWQQGALKVNQDKGGFVAISAHREPMPAAPTDDHVPSNIFRATDNYSFPALNFTDLMLPKASTVDPAAGLGVYRPPYTQFSSTVIFGWHRDDIPISADEMVRKPELDPSGKPTGNVLWTFTATRKNSQDLAPVTFTVPAGSAQDRYLSNYQAFSTPPSGTGSNANRPTANVLKSGEVVSTSSGSKLEIWTPREHQFNADANGKAVQVVNKPIITVDGQRATILSVRRVKLSNVQGDSYTVTVKTASGRTETFIHSPKTKPEEIAFKNADVLVNGGKESAIVNLAEPDAAHASVLAGKTVSGSGITYFYPGREVTAERAAQLDSKLSAFLGRPVTAADIPDLLKAGHIKLRDLGSSNRGYIVTVSNVIPAGANPWPNISEKEYLRNNPIKLPPGKTPSQIFPLYQRPDLLGPIKPGQDNIEIIPHRGVFTLGKGVPENSLKSITAAIGADKNGKFNHSSTEVDIMYTKDGHAILAHDTTPGRVLAAYRNADGSAKLFKDASGKVRPYRWTDLTLKEVQKDPMIINEQDPNTGKFTGRYTLTDQKVLSLKEALDHAIKINPNATVFLDARAQDAGKAIAWLASNPQYKGRVAVKTYAYEYDNAAAVETQVNAEIDKMPIAAEKKAELKKTWKKAVHIVPVLTADQTNRLAKAMTGKADPTDAERRDAGIAWFASFDKAGMTVAAREIPIETIGEYYNPVTKLIEATPRRRDGTVSPLPILTAAEVQKANEDKKLLDMFEGDSAQIDIFSHFNKHTPKTPVMQSYRSDDYETSDGIYGIYDWQTGLPGNLVSGLPSLGRAYRATPGALAHYGNWFITDRPLEEKAYLADQKDGKDDIVETRENPTLDLDPNENLSRGPR